ncbi:MAG: 3-phosphoshikimate 1-carboxyvinyltransferase [Candidatus Izemoplasmatales bacterium]
MDVLIHPNYIKGQLTPPPSKSYLHRAIIAASLASGKSVIKNILIGDDIQQTIEAFRSLGVKIEYLDNQLIIESTGKFNFNDNHAIYCHESGSTLRFLMPLLTNEKGVEFHGQKSLLSRPLDLYEKIFSNQNVAFVRFDNYIYTEGKIKASTYHIKDDTSSQYVSGLLFSLPRLNGDSEIIIKENFESRKYIDMTIYMLKQFGIKIETITNNHFLIPGNQLYKASEIDIESDYSQAAFFVVGALLNGDVTIKNLNINSLQPDKKIIDILLENHANIDVFQDSIRVKKSLIDIQNIDLSQTIDLGPILFLLATQSKSKTSIIHINRLIHKESNRLENMIDILKILKVKYNLLDDQIIVYHQNIIDIKDISSYNDHRIAMALAILSIVSKTPTIIRQMEVINKSYPTFLNDLENLGIKIEYL